MDDNEKTILAREFIRSYIQLKKTITERPQSGDIKRNELVLMMIIIDKISSGLIGVKASELSTILHITPSAVTHMINSLEEKEYLERLSDKKDRRIVLIRPTDLGIKAIQDRKTQLFDELKELLDFLGEKDSKELIRILKLVVDFKDKTL